MSYLPKRRNIRNPYHDYGQPCSYFITIDIRLGQCLFGKAKSETEIELNPLGQVAKNQWQSIPIHFPHVLLGKLIVMPNHIHGIIHIGPQTEPDEPIQNANIKLPFIVDHSSNAISNQFGPLEKGSLAVIMGQYKASVTRWANNNRFGGLFDWHDRFYDRIIIDKDALMAAEKYIEQNPEKWWAKYGNKQW